MKLNSVRWGDHTTGTDYVYGYFTMLHQLVMRYSIIYTVTVLVIIDGVWIDEHLQLVTTSKEYALTVPNSSQITVGHTGSSQSVRVFARRCLVAASKGGLSPSSVSRIVPGLNYRLFTTTHKS
jgi:hypothetical protein